MTDQADCANSFDVAREVYKENVGDIFSLSNALSEEHDLPLILVPRHQLTQEDRSRE
ncbi:uncharacterized protein PHACADRAFT_246517 [Phanerochaete carnosa HHB-10118-sp]|uniref:Uncharacterized protein n=1 Tax=Phanerochaete carnosa (strain HHB-10118-sp) TaxID=650164 RepID=K5WMT5_PHACS|nr:uncharacterized protein PHACADRAFT_246517 [Phanerochaete carnosa HHB-10118-sp]EKM60519.1 hypothetical protein PHACADRAFT_246517 [Phanerochaete carnosa HHB-10118-sp]